VEFIRDPLLLHRVRSEISAARLDRPDGQRPGFNISKLCEGPLLQSVYAETLRLRIAIILMRSPEKHDFKLGKWLFKTGDLIFLCSQTAARNRDLWNDGTDKDPHPLDEFWAERFLVYPNDPASGPVKKNSADGRAISSPDNNILENEKPPETAAVEKRDPKFSMEGLAGGWVPFGGDVRMCPGRFFAKNEMMASLAMIVTSYDIELRTPEGWKPEPDMSYFLVGALPPKGAIPVRIRRRVS